jgi:hypothetical protein
LLDAFLSRTCSGGPTGRAGRAATAGLSAAACYRSRSSREEASAGSTSRRIVARSAAGSTAAFRADRRLFGAGDFGAGEIDGAAKIGKDNKSSGRTSSLFMEFLIGGE